MNVLKGICTRSLSSFRQFRSATKKPTPYKINDDRLSATIDEFSQIGKTIKGGVSRLALSPEDKKARELFIKLATEADCTIEVDIVGNIFARREGKDPSAPSILTGSHMDTQPLAGKFDGTYGVLAGLEILRSMKEQNLRTVAPIEVVSWTNEEGSRFAPAMMGSGVASGVIPVDHALAVKDKDGITVEQALTEIGFKGSIMPGHRLFGAYLEAHIEQGPILEAMHCAIGSVSGAQGLRWYTVEVLGKEGHAGTTPMNRRKDAMLASAKLITHVHKVAMTVQPYGVATVGAVDVIPNSRNTIPGIVKLSIDLRHPQADALKRMDAELTAKLKDIAFETHCDIRVKQVMYSQPVGFHTACTSIVREAAIASGYEVMDIVSGAGHDACYMARVTPTGMLFIPCLNGISHSEEEHVSKDQCTAGANTLFTAVVALANGEPIPPVATIVQTDETA